MSKIAWSTEHSVETEATAVFAWSYMTDVSNWDDPPAKFTLDGPFAPGTPGTTQMPDQPPHNWEIRSVEPGKSYILEFSLEDAALSFEWQFHSLPGARARISQRIILEGQNASTYLAQLQEMFGSNLGPGMNKIAAAIARAYAIDSPRS